MMTTMMLNKNVAIATFVDAKNGGSSMTEKEDHHTDVLFFNIMPCFTLSFRNIFLLLFLGSTSRRNCARAFGTNAITAKNPIYPAAVRRQIIE